MSLRTKEKNKVKILIVDDHPENLIALEKTLKPLDLDVYKATSGNQALQLMLEENFVLVLLDVMMPIMDGFEVAKLMHQNEITKHIPIVFLTAINKSENFYLKGMELGAVDYLYKPIDPTVLLSKVKVFVDLYETREELKETISALTIYQQRLEETNITLKKLSEEDSLTGLSNRRFFEKEFREILASSTDNLVAIIFFDIDNFKMINDKYGHPSGDTLIMAIADRIREIKTVEINGETFQFNIMARLGGDEFAIVVKDIKNNVSNLNLIAKKIMEVMSAPFNITGTSIQNSISMGVAYFPDDGKTISDLMKAADIALYNAKLAGKNCYKVYNNSFVKS